jgi:UDP-N-acetylmuramoyl-L-alanyl-D-glutamate--2,6-diaminopimelate ligase
MADNDIDYAVMEVSSHSLELGRVDGCNFRVGIFTNLTQDHLDFHKTIENYRNAKKKLFYMTKGANIINIDDEHGRIIAEEAGRLEIPLITYGIDNKADIMAKNIYITAKGVCFTLITPDYEEELSIRIPGKFSVYNALAAASAAYVEGVSGAVIREGLANVKNVPGRSEILKTDTPYTIIVDYAHTPDGLQNILASVKEYATGRVITLFGCGGDRDKEKRPMMGDIAGRMSDYCIITSDNPRSEEPMSIIKQIEDGIKSTDCDYICIENRRDAIKFALKMAKSDDIVLLAGKGHETYQVLKDRTIPFDERDIVEELLREEI